MPATAANEQPADQGVLGVPLEDEAVDSLALLVAVHQAHCRHPLGAAGAPGGGVHRPAKDRSSGAAHFAGVHNCDGMGMGLRVIRIYGVVVVVVVED